MGTSQQTLRHNNFNPHTITLKKFNKIKLSEIALGCFSKIRSMEKEQSKSISPGITQKKL